MEKYFAVTWLFFKQLILFLQRRVKNSEEMHFWIIFLDPYLRSTVDKTKLKC